MSPRNLMTARTLIASVGLVFATASFGSEPTGAATCLYQLTEQPFIAQPLPFETKIQFAEADLATPVQLEESVHRRRDLVSEQLKSIFRPPIAPLRNLKIALNLSAKNSLHVATVGLSQSQHGSVMKYIEDEKINLLLAAVPPSFRNKYFEIVFNSKGEAQCAAKFAWELLVPLQSQLLTGFALESNSWVSPFRLREATFAIRTDLHSQNRSQECYVTCGLSSLAQTFQARGVNLNEEDLTKLAEQHNIKLRQDILGTNPGFDLALLAELARRIGQDYNFKATLHYVASPNSAAHEFEQLAADVVSKKVDVIVNYMSPVIGRPGAGHFSPIAGFDAQSRRVLVSEVNLASNPPFWVQSDQLLKAMAPQEDEEVTRGYIVLHWNRE